MPSILSNACDCGCGRSAVFGVPGTDLGFSLKCIGLWVLACEAHGFGLEDLLPGQDPPPHLTEEILTRAMEELQGTP